MYGWEDVSMNKNRLRDIIGKMSIPEDSYKNSYFVFIHELSDGVLSVVFTKGSPLNLWEFVYRKYYGGVGDVMLSALLDFCKSDILTYYANNYLTPTNPYTHENFIHLHLITLATSNSNMIYFYFRKYQSSDVGEVLYKVLNLSTQQIEDIIHEVINKANLKPTEIQIIPKRPTLKPSNTTQQNTNKIENQEELYYGS